jgi:hypothetical protein
VKRFVAALMLVNGLLVAGGANAAELGPLTYDCALNPSNSQITVSGNIGDTYTVNAQGGGVPPHGDCTGPNYTVANIVSNTAGPLSNQARNSMIFTLSASGTTVATLVNSDLGSLALTFNVNAPTSIPSLSESTQLLLGLMVMMLIGWHFHRERSY